MKTYVKLAFLSLVSVSLAACAKSPDSIAPMPMTGVYDGVSCDQARRMLESERKTLAALDSAQRSAVAGDAIGVFLIGVPVSSLSGSDKEGHIATSKGKVIALEGRMMTCR